ncbi:hypothetical protein [Helicobacter ganmani]|uniref:hypothetical protein n=1 Tax=Helicobacter ganmani TaxID=60246 RepID=UPI003A8A56C2
MEKLLVYFCLSSAFVSLVFMGCASKPIYKITTKEVFIPVQCNLKLPVKPKENGTFESHKALAVYYRKVEQIAKDCTRFKEERR